MYTALEQSQLQTQPNYHKIHKQKVIHIFIFGGFTMFPYFQWLKFKPHAAGWSASFRLRQPWIPSRWNGSPWTFDLHSCHSPTSLGKLGWDWVLRLDQSLKVKRWGKKTLILSTKCEVKGWISAVLKLMEGAKKYQRWTSFEPFWSQRTVWDDVRCMYDMYGPWVLGPRWFNPAKRDSMLSMTNDQP